MPLRQNLERLRDALESLSSEYKDKWEGILLHPSMSFWARVTIVASAAPLSYMHITTPIGFYTARMLVGSIIIISAIRLHFLLVTKYAYASMTIGLNLYCVICLASLSFHSDMISHTPLTLFLLPVFFLINSIFLNAWNSIYLNTSLFALASVPFILFMVGPHAQLGWTPDKNDAAYAMGVSFASIFLMHFSTLAAHLAAASFEQARSEIREAQMSQALEREREKFRSDLARMNRVFIIETMSTTLTHEISQPINSTSVFVGAIKRWLRAPSSNVAEALIAAEKASGQIDRAREIIESIRGFVRKGCQDHQLVNLVECVNEILILMGKEFTFRKIHVEMKMNSLDENITVIGLHYEIKQIIANLLLNSIEAFNDDSENRRIEIVFSKSMSSAALQVIDNGEGLSATMKEGLFSKFVTTKETGTGLGLSISVDLAEKFGGQLELEQRPQGGAIATLRLPLAEGASVRDQGPVFNDC